MTDKRKIITLLKKILNNPKRAYIKIQNKKIKFSSQHLFDRSHYILSLFRGLYLKAELQHYQMYKNETTCIKPIIYLKEEKIKEDSIKITHLNNKMTVTLYTTNHLGDIAGFYKMKFIDVGSDGFGYVKE